METTVFKMGSNVPKFEQTKNHFPGDERKHLIKRKPKHGGVSKNGPVIDHQKANYFACSAVYLIICIITMAKRLGGEPQFLLHLCSTCYNKQSPLQRPWLCLLTEYWCLELLSGFVV